jgi:hypothetical protein
MIKKIKREGLDATKHHPHITDGDLEKQIFWFFSHQQS